MGALRTSTKNRQIKSSLMPNYVFLILRKFHFIIFKVLKTSFKQKEYTITLIPSNISERSQFIKSRVCYFIRKNKSWWRNQKLRRRWGFHWSQQGPAGFAMGKPIHSQVIRDRFWRKPRCHGSEGEPPSPHMVFSPRAVSQSKLHSAVASGEMAQPKAAHKDIPRHWDWHPAPLTAPK